MKKHETIAEYIFRCIQTGNLTLGDYLPSIRKLAETLNVSATTVFDAYCKLENIGLVESRERKGFMITDISDVPSTDALVENASIPVSDIFQSHFRSSGEIDSKNIVPLGMMCPPNIFLPSDELSKCLSRVARTNPREINNYGFAKNVPAERRSIDSTTAQHMFKTLGITVSESEICPANGATEGIFIALSAVTKRGDVVAVESPGFRGVFSHLERLGLIPLEIDALPPHGFDVKALKSAIQSGKIPKCVVVTPNFQNPTGSLMPLENRVALIDICTEHGIAIIEDDVLGALRFGERVASLKELRPDDVIYVNSYSKTLAPGYRVGWVAGGRHIQNIRIVQGIESHVMTRFSHLAVAQYIESGKYKHYIKDLRKIYEKNACLMRDALLAAFPKGTNVFSPAGGQFLWLALPGGISASSLFYEALSRNILLAPGTFFSDSGKYVQNMRFCFALELTNRIFESIDLIGKIAKDT